MKAEKQKIRKSTIELLREIRDKISAETQDMTFDQLKKYVDEHLTETLHPNAAWHKQTNQSV
jgi:hypothetical protein